MEQFAFPSELSGEGLKRIRRKLKLTQAEFASFAGVSVKTVERWETAGQPISGPIVVLVNLLEEYPRRFFDSPEGVSHAFMVLFSGEALHPDRCGRTA